MNQEHTLNKHWQKNPNVGFVVKTRMAKNLSVHVNAVKILLDVIVTWLRKNTIPVVIVPVVSIIICHVAIVDYVEWNQAHQIKYSRVIMRNIQ
jgi:hypothetical protein